MGFRRFLLSSFAVRVARIRSSFVLGVHAIDIGRGACKDGFALSATSSSRLCNYICQEFIAFPVVHAMRRETPVCPKVPSNSWLCPVELVLCFMMGLDSRSL